MFVCWCVSERVIQCVHTHINECTSDMLMEGKGGKMKGRGREETPFVRTKSNM